MFPKFWKNKGLDYSAAQQHALAEAPIPAEYGHNREPLDFLEQVVRAHYLQHVPFEGLGSIADWLSARGAVVTATELFDPAQRLPAVEDFDLLIAMGGPMSVSDEAEYPWLVAEKALIADAVAAGKAVLGVCLGAQLIASALGAGVHPNPVKEIGWFPVAACPAPPPGAFVFPESAQVFHWHGDTFELPRGAVRLASSEACKNQAFQLGERVMGLQFHLEVTPDSLAAMLADGAGELVSAAWIQSAESMQATEPACYAGVNALLERVLDYLTRP